MKLSLIIPTLNRPDSLRQCLRSILQSENGPDEIFVVDQSTNQDALEKDRDFCSSITMANWICTDFQSSTKARNVGMARANGDVLIFSDDDVTFKPDFFEKVRLKFNNKDLALLGTYNLLDPKPKKGLHLFARLTSYRSFFHKTDGYCTKAVLGVLPERKRKIADTIWAMGYCFCIRRSVALQSKLQFDEKMSGYAFNEDLDFTYRFCAEARNMGLLCQYQPNIFVEHHVSQEFRVPSTIFYLAWLGNRYYLSRKLRIGSKYNIWKTYVALLMKLNISSQKDAAKNLKEARRIVKKNIIKIQKGDLDYKRMLAAKEEPL